MAEPDTAQVDSLVESVLASPKYRYISPETVRRIGAQELAKRRTLKEAEKATRNKLHQIGGAYLAGEMPYDLWLHELETAIKLGHSHQIRQICTRAMSYHASTRERLKILDRFYTTILPQLPAVHHILDVACGLNPLAIPWMPLPGDVIYDACDIYSDMCSFLNSFFHLIGVHGQAQVCDAMTSPPSQHVDLALVLKTIPCLEQIDKTAGARLLESLNADRLLVSFPVHSLGGRAKGMSENYQNHFESLISGKGWTAQRFEFETELAFLVKK